MTELRGLVVSDVDGTLITPNHEITARAKRAVLRLKEHAIGFTIASSRPPRGLEMLLEALDIVLPFAPFNGAQIASPEGRVLEKQIIPVASIGRVWSIAEEFHLNLWAYRGWKWFARRRDEFVEREEHTVGFTARVFERIEDCFEDCPKLTVVGMPEIVALCAQTIRQELGSELAATQSQPRFIDITVKGANKGSVITSLSRILQIPVERVAAIGDGPNDVEMFARAGLSIAMGNGSEVVQKAARYVTTSNAEEGFANGIETYVLEGAMVAGG
ncbi:MAG: HAD family hydrolase [Acidobacteriia bacterium]|nr:HAD family hydrolase [Terriglobia bacterium]